VLTACHALGAHWTLAKPFRPEELLVAMRALLLDQASHEYGEPRVNNVWHNDWL